MEVNERESWTVRERQEEAFNAGNFELTSEAFSAHDFFQQVWVEILEGTSAEQRWWERIREGVECIKNQETFARVGLSIVFR